MTKINVNLNSDKYHQERRKYKNNKRFTVIEDDHKFTVKERNKFYIPKVIAAASLSIISLGLIPLCSKSVRELFSRKIIVYTQNNQPKIISNVSKSCLYHPENLVPDSQMPEDVINLMTHFLEPNELAGLKSVNKDWYNYISEKKSFEVITAHMESMLKEILDDSLVGKESAFINAVAQYDIERAWALAQSMSDTDQVLLELVRIEAKTDLKQAQATIEKIQNHDVKREARLDLLEMQITRTMERLNRLETYAKQNRNVKTEIENAKEKAAGIERDRDKARALLEIVKIEAKSDLEGAKQTAEGIKDDYLRGVALIEIVKVEAKTDIESAKETAQLINYSRNDRNRDEAILEIIKIEAENDLISARKTAQGMNDKFLMNQAFIEIIMVEAKKDLNSAKKTVRGMPDCAYKDGAFAGIAKVEAETDIEGAKETTEWIDNERIRNKALIEIAKIEAQTDLVAAQKTAGIISEIPQKIDAFIEILLVMGKKKQKGVGN